MTLRPQLPWLGEKCMSSTPLCPLVFCVWEILTYFFSPGFSRWLLSLWVGHFCVSIAKSSV